MSDGLREFEERMRRKRERDAQKAREEAERQARFLDTPPEQPPGDTLQEDTIVGLLGCVYPPDDEPGVSSGEPD